MSAKVKKGNQRRASRARMSELREQVEERFKELKPKDISGLCNEGK